MFQTLTRRAEELAARAQQAKAAEVAAQLRALVGPSAVEVEAQRVVIIGRGLIRRWLVDPALRFLGGMK